MLEEQLIHPSPRFRSQAIVGDSGDNPMAGRIPGLKRGLERQNDEK
jgi:hypothetical protein